jgi:hypothetical protein
MYSLKLLGVQQLATRKEKFCEHGEMLCRNATPRQPVKRLFSTALRRFVMAIELPSSVRERLPLKKSTLALLLALTSVAPAFANLPQPPRPIFPQHPPACRPYDRDCKTSMPEPSTTGMLSVGFAVAAGMLLVSRRRAVKA